MSKEEEKEKLLEKDLTVLNKRLGNFKENTPEQMNSFTQYDLFESLLENYASATKQQKEKLTESLKKANEYFEQYKDHIDTLQSNEKAQHADMLKKIEKITTLIEEKNILPKKEEKEAKQEQKVQQTPEIKNKPKREKTNEKPIPQKQEYVQNNEEKAIANAAKTRDNTIKKEISASLEAAQIRDQLYTILHSDESIDSKIARAKMVASTASPEVQALPHFINIKDKLDEIEESFDNKVKAEIKESQKAVIVAEQQQEQYEEQQQKLEEVTKEIEQIIQQEIEELHEEIKKDQVEEKKENNIGEKEKREEKVQKTIEEITKKIEEKFSTDGLEKGKDDEKIEEIKGKQRKEILKDALQEGHLNIQEEDKKDFDVAYAKVLQAIEIAKDSPEKLEETSKIIEQFKNTFGEEHAEEIEKFDIEITNISTKFEESKIHEQKSFQEGRDMVLEYFEIATNSQEIEEAQEMLESFSSVWEENPRLQEQLEEVKEKANQKSFDIGYAGVLQAIENAKNDPNKSEDTQKMVDAFKTTWENNPNPKFKAQFEAIEESIQEELKPLTTTSSQKRQPLSEETIKKQTTQSLEVIPLSSLPNVVKNLQNDKENKL